MATNGGIFSFGEFSAMDAMPPSREKVGTVKVIEAAGSGRAPELALRSLDSG